MTAIYRRGFCISEMMKKDICSYHTESDGLLSGVVLKVGFIAVSILVQTVLFSAYRSQVTSGLRTGEGMILNLGESLIGLPTNLHSHTKQRNPLRETGPTSASILFVSSKANFNFSTAYELVLISSGLV